MLFYFLLTFCFSKAKIIPDDVLLSPNNTKHVWDLDDATLFSRVHFTEFHIPHGARVEVYNPKTGERHHLDSYLRGAQTPLSVDGNECAVELVGEFDWDAEKHRITIDYISQFLPEDMVSEDPDVDSESGERRNLGYCGALDQIEPVECMTTSHQISNAKAVVKIRSETGSGTISRCTGFFFGAHNRLLTNHHCIRSFIGGSASAEVELFYQETDCSHYDNSWSPWPWAFPSGCHCSGSKTTMKINVRAVIATWPEQDASLISLDYSDADDFEHKVLKYYDQLQATSSPFQVPAVGDEVYIISHPGGIKKVISRTNDNGDMCKITYYNSASGRFRTNCETEGGSSGAPVFFANGDLLGLHNSGGYPCPTNLDQAMTTGGWAMWKIWDRMKNSQFQCCGKFHKSNGYGNPTTARRFCDDIPYVWGDYHDDISSMQITSGCRVYVYEDIMMSGAMKTFTGSKTNLGDWNNRISSLRFARTDGDRCWVKFYPNHFYDGTFYFFTQDQPIIYNDAWESGDSAFTSFKIKSGCAIKFYKGSHYTGESMLVDSDQPYVGDNFNDQISSFRLIDTSQKCWIRLYKQEKCLGSDNEMFYIDVEELPSSWNDQAKSMQIMDNCMAQVFQDKDFEGTHAVFPSWQKGSIYANPSNAHIWATTSSMIQGGSSCIANLKYKWDDNNNVELTMTDKVTSFRLFHLEHRATRRSLLEEETGE